MFSTLEVVSLQAVWYKHEGSEAEKKLKKMAWKMVVMFK